MKEGGSRRKHDRGIPTAALCMGQGGTKRGVGGDGE